MHVRVVFVPLAALVLAACSSSTQYRIDSERGAQRQQDDPIASYRRSHPTAPPEPSYQPFASVQGDTLTLTFNPTLLARQTREICQEKPVAKVAVPPPYIRRCLSTSWFGCAEYEARRGEEQPPCLRMGPKLTSKPAICVEREDPNVTTYRYDTVRDCYQSPAPPDVAGSIFILQVPTGTRGNDIRSPNRHALAAVKLTPAQPVRTISLPAVDAKQCLMLYDSGGQSISLRGNPVEPGNDLFMTPAMLASRTNQALIQSVKDAENKVRAWQDDQTRLTSYLSKDVAWNGSRCITPPTAPLPREPKVMGDREVEVHAKAYCLISLGDQADANLVLSAARAKQRYDFIKAVQMIGTDPTKVAACVQGSHTYSDQDLAYLRGEIMQDTLGRCGTSLQELLKCGLESMGKQITVTQQAKHNLISSMLGSCAGTAVASCRAPYIAWQDEVRRIRAAPQEAFNSCQALASKAAEGKAGLERAKAELAAAQTAAQTKQVQAGSQSFDIAQLSCRAP